MKDGGQQSVAGTLEQNGWSSLPLPALSSSGGALASSSGSSDSLQARKETHPGRLFCQMCYFCLL